MTPLDLGEIFRQAVGGSMFLAVPVAAETCGPVIDDRDGIVFISVQHPGEEGSWDDPDSYFPDYLDQGELRDGAWGGPRPSVVQIHWA